jgi:hypothetical protein
MAADRSAASVQSRVCSQNLRSKGLRVLDNARPLANARQLTTDY